MNKFYKLISPKKKYLQVCTINAKLINFFLKTFFFHSFFNKKSFGLKKYFFVQHTSKIFSIKKTTIMYSNDFYIKKKKKISNTNLCTFKNLQLPINIDTFST